MEELTAKFKLALQRRRWHVQNVVIREEGQHLLFRFDFLCPCGRTIRETVAQSSPYFERPQTRDAAFENLIELCDQELQAHLDEELGKEELRSAQLEAQRYGYIDRYQVPR